MSDERNWAKLVGPLLRRTIDRTLHWDTGTETELIALLKESAIHIGKAEGYYWVALRNENGTLLDVTNTDERPELRVDLGELWELARSQALRVDETWDATLRELAGGGN